MQQFCSRYQVGLRQEVLVVVVIPPQSSTVFDSDLVIGAASTG